MHMLWGQLGPKNGIVQDGPGKISTITAAAKEHLSTELVSLPVRKQNAQSEPFQGNLGTAKLQTEEIRIVSALE